VGAIVAFVLRLRKETRLCVKHAIFYNELTCHPRKRATPLSEPYASIRALLLLLNYTKIENLLYKSICHFLN